MRVSGGTQSSVILAEAGETIAIVLSEPADQAAGTIWEIYVDAKLEEAGFVRVGAMNTDPVAWRKAPARVVALAMCPGARAWRVIIGNAVPGTTAEIFMAAGSSPMSPANGAAVAAQEGNNIPH